MSVAVASTVRAFCKRTLSSQDLLPATVEPWRNDKPIPPLPNKQAYRAWCVQPTTDHVFFNLCEGENAAMPVGSGNKVAKIHGYIADYDTSGVTLAEVAAALSRGSPQYQPFAYNITFSGGVRMVWLFEEPVFHYSPAVYKKFIKRVVRETKSNAIMGGLDDTSEQAGRFFTAGTGWVINENASPIRAAASHLWLTEACKGDEFDGHGVEIPIDRVAAEVERRFPNRWEGEFVVGARGVRFWDPSADAHAAIVRSNGVQCFTGSHSFMTWEAIFGREFVQAYLEDKLGAAIRDIYSDGRYYYRQLPDERWDAMNTEQARRHLTVKYGLDGRAGRDDAASECDMALHRIELTKRVDGALPFPHNPKTVVDINGVKILNTSTARLVTPALDAVAWGEDFPWLADYLTGLFKDEKTLMFFLSWLHVWLKSLHEGDPRKGHALFIVGPPNTGKTLLSTKIISRIVGGSAEVTQFIVDGNQYNNAAFEKALWTVDDASPGASPGAHAKFSSAVKSIVANGTFRYEKKYGSAMDVPFFGRLITTLNEDPNSLAILPDADNSLLDKVMILRTSSRPAPVAYDPAERMQVIDRELPYFVRYVLDFQMPDYVELDARLGIKPFHDPELLEDAREVTHTNSLIDTIEIWKHEWARVHSTQRRWAGTPTELLGALRDCAQTTHAVATMNSRFLGRLLNQAISNNNNTPWLSRRRVGSQGKKQIIIELPTKEQIELRDKEKDAA